MKDTHRYLNAVTAFENLMMMCPNMDPFSILKRQLYFHVHCNVIHNSQGMETIQVSKNRWKNKENVVFVNI